MKRATLFVALFGASFLAASPDPPAKSPGPARLLRTLAHDPGGYNPERVNVVTELLLGDLPSGKLDAQSHVTPAAGPAARRGEALFTKARAGFGGQSCASCHVPSSFFCDGRPHRLQRGAGALQPSFEDGFETPTLLGTIESAPYFHDGRFATLGEVVAWFDTTYGLSLTQGERADLTAYLEAVGSADNPEDRRLLAHTLDATFVYLELLAAGSVKDDRRVWTAVVALCLEALDGAPRRADFDERRLRDRRRLVDLEAQARAAASLDALGEEAKLLHRELTRYGSDLQGAIAAERR